MLNTLLRTGLAAVDYRLMLDGGDLDGWAIYENAFVADWHCALRMDADVLARGLRGDAFRGGYCEDPNAHFDLVLLGERGSEAIGRECHWAVEVKLWIANVSLAGKMLEDYKHDIRKLQGPRHKTAAFALWIAGEPGAMRVEDRYREKVENGLGIKGKPFARAMRMAKWNNDPCPTELWIWQVK